MSRRLNLEPFPPRHEPVLAWLRANNIEPRCVPVAQEVRIDKDSITLDLFVRDEQGQLVVENHRPVIKRVTVPLISSPAAYNLFF